MCKCTIKDTPEIRAQVWEKVSTYIKKYGSSESIAQGDNAQIKAPELMCEISDLLCPEYEDDEE